MRNSAKSCIDYYKTWDNNLCVINKEDIMSLTIDRPAVRSDLRFHPATALIGADVTGIDLRDELDPATVARLREGLLKYKVLFFRDQAIDDVQQIRFTRYFGPVTPAHPVTNGLVRTCRRSRSTY